MKHTKSSTISSKGQVTVLLGVRKRLLSDFIVGSHALEQADRLMTLDPKRYNRDFPELKII